MRDITEKEMQPEKDQRHIRKERRKIKNKQKQGGRVRG
jgi:hypothetical protein